MLVAAALVPETVLLLRGAGGRADPLAPEREGALAALRAVLGARPDRVVLVTPPARRTSTAPAGSPAGPARVTTAARARAALGAAGIPDRFVTEAGGGLPHAPRADLAATDLAATGLPGVDPQADAPASVAAAVGLLLLELAGGADEVVTVTATGDDVPALRATGRDVAADGRRTALVLMGSLSARTGLDAPLPHDERAPAFDDAAVAALTALDEPGLRWLASVPGELADELAVSAWAPWQVLLGAVRDDDGADHPDDGGGRAASDGAGTVAVVHGVSAPFGATCVALSWVPVTADAP